MGNNNTTTAEAQQATTQPEENGAQSEKTFTQDEVNKIVSDRLAREKAKADTSTHAEEKEIEKRENAVECKAYIYDNDLPKELLEILDTSNKETFIANIEKLKPLLKTKENATPSNFKVGADDSTSTYPYGTGTLATAFKLNR